MKQFHPCRCVTHGLMALALFLPLSCGLPLVIPDTLQDQVGLTSLMTLEKTFAFTGLENYQLDTLIPDGTEGDTVPWVFSVPGGDSYLIVPHHSDTDWNPLMGDSGSTIYTTFATGGGNTSNTAWNSGFYIFCLDQGSTSSRVEFSIGDLQSPTSEKPPAFMFIPCMYLNYSSVSHLWGFLGTSSGSTWNLKAGLISQYWIGGPTGTGTLLYVLDKLPVFNTATANQGQEPSHTLLFGTPAANNLLGGLSTPVSDDLYGYNFVSPRLIDSSSDTYGYGLYLLTNKLNRIKGYFTLPWQAGNAAAMAVSSAESYWPYAPAAQTYGLPLQDIDISNYRNGIGHIYSGLLSLRTDPDEAKKYGIFLSTPDIPDEGEYNSCISMDSKIGYPSRNRQYIQGLPIMRFLADGTGIAWNGITWKVAAFEAGNDLAITPSTDWKILSLPELVFIGEYRDGTTWKLRFCQVLYYQGASGYTVEYRILSIPLDRYKSWFYSQ